MTLCLETLQCRACHVANVAQMQNTDARHGRTILTSRNSWLTEINRTPQKEASQHRQSSLLTCKAGRKAVGGTFRQCNTHLCLVQLSVEAVTGITLPSCYHIAGCQHTCKIEQAHTDQPQPAILQDNHGWPLHASRLFTPADAAHQPMHISRCYTPADAMHTPHAHHGCDRTNQALSAISQRA